MKNILKAGFGIMASTIILGASIAPAVMAWGDNSSESGRRSYTEYEINHGALGDKIVFNSISDNKTYGGDEKYFLSTREKNGTGNYISGNKEIKDEETYVLRIYVHNDNPKGYDAIAKDVTVGFSIPDSVGKSIEVNGYINSSNATPSAYWDSVTFTSDQDFYLSYVPGSALLENNGVGKNGGVALSDDIIYDDITIGYDSLNGEIPGCFEYDSVVTIEVQAHLVEEDDFISKQVRLKGTKEWYDAIDANVGDEVEYQIQYKNTGNATDYNVMIRDILPTNMEYVAGSTVLYNSNHPEGATVNSDDIVTSGINIGNYEKDSNAYIRFTAKVVDKTLACYTNKLVNWAQAGINGKTGLVEASANVFVEKTCDNNDDNDDDNNNDDNNNQNITVTPKQLPTTGPTAIVGGVIGAGSVVTSLGYYLASRKKMH